MADPDALDADSLTDLRFADRACYLVDADVLVLADLHVGKAAASDVAFPLGERTDLAERFGALLDRFEPTEAVLAGDVLHSFSTVPDGASETLADLRRHARERGVRLVAVRGNHDTMLDSVWDGPVETEYRVGDTVVCHGHERPTARAARYVVGHDHPVITIEGRRRPCALLGTYRDVPGAADADDTPFVMLPAFTRLASGRVVNALRASEFQSPLVTDADALRPLVRDDDAGETHRFPPLGAFRDLL